MPIVCGKPQATGKQFFGKLSVQEDAVTVDLADAYDIPELSKLKRTFALREKEIVLADEFDLQDICERLISTYPFRSVTEGELEVKGVRLRYDESIWEAIVKTEMHTKHSGEEIAVYVCDFIAKREHNGCFSLCIAFD